MMLSDKLDRFNEWWGTRKVRESLAPPYRRRPFSQAVRLLGDRQAVILTGLRRVGKSTILYQTAQEILRKTDPSRLLYFSFEEGGEGVAEVMREYESRVLKRTIERAGRVYALLDEVQYAPDWVQAVKRYYDLYPNVKFFLSGSSSLLISGRALSSLAGRFFFVGVAPMAFREFVEVRGEMVPSGEPTSRLEPLFNDYLGKAGFPEVAGWEDENKVEDYVRNSVVDRVLFRDAPTLLGRKDPLLMGKLLSTVCSRPGGMVNLNSLSRDLGSSRLTVSRYLRSLETSLLLRSLSNFRPSSRSSSRKLRKYYPATTSLIKAVSRGAFEQDRGGVLETYVVNVLRAASYYRRGQAEIDVISEGGELAVEVKTKPDRRDLARLGRLADWVGAKRRVIVSQTDGRSIGGVDVVPAYALEWELGLGPQS
jgi:hypothetical protein